MIKIKNKILIYFIFYINNISFLKNEENEKTLTETQIQDYNNKETNSEQKNENITSENDKNKIKKYKLIFNNIFNKINKKNIWFLIPLGIVLLLIFFFAIYKIWKKYNFYKKYKEKIKLFKDFFVKNLDLFDIYISIKFDCYQNKYIYISNNQILLEYFDKLFINITDIFIGFIIYELKKNIFSIESSHILNELKKFKDTMNNKKMLFFIDPILDVNNKKISKALFSVKDIENKYEKGAISKNLFFILSNSEKIKNLIFEIINNDECYEKKTNL